ncbi:MAG: hypothetical protein FJ275_03050 [Planctomycetes bacterium]|nr:hypothetical protein [Planctomycetota bacterium]
MPRSTLTAAAPTATFPPPSERLPLFRIAFSACVLMLVSLAAPARLSAQGPATEPNRDGIADLVDRLTTGLRVKAPADVAFCERVATLVREGRLPVALVDSTYAWATDRGKKYPFPAFQHVIRLKAAKLGVPL